jgi:hypothetical protein
MTSRKSAASRRTGDNPHDRRAAQFRRSDSGATRQEASRPAWFDDAESRGLAATIIDASSRRTRICRNAFQPSPNHSGLAMTSNSSNSGASHNGGSDSSVSGGIGSKASGSQRDIPQAAHAAPGVPCSARTRPRNSSASNHSPPTVGAMLCRAWPARKSPPATANHDCASATTRRTHPRNGEYVPRRRSAPRAGRNQFSRSTRA